MTIPVLLVYAVLGYLAVGVPVGAIVTLWALGRVDPVAVGTSVRVRLVLLPGAVALWPIMLTKFLRSGRDSRGGDSSGDAGEGAPDGA